MKEFVSALAQVRRTYDLLFDSNGGMTALFGEPPEAAVRRKLGSAVLKFDEAKTPRGF
jgi:hypothetical protein